MAGRLFIVSDLYYPEDSTTGHYMTGIAEGLAGNRHVDVICGQPKYCQRGLRAPRQELRNGVNIYRCRGTTFDKNVYPLKMVNMLSLTLPIFFTGLFKICSGDVVLVVTTPPLLPFVVSMACRLRGARCILCIHDVYPEAMVYAGVLKRGRFIEHLLGWMTKRLYQRVDRIVVLGRDMARLVRAKTRNKDKVVVITNWADTDTVTPEPRGDNVLLTQLGLKDKFVVGYAGNIGPLQDIENLLQVALSLRNESEVHFLFIGTGKKAPWLARAVKDSAMSNVTLLGQKPRSERNNFLNACDVALISLVPGMAGVGVPSRMYNILAAGKSIIAVTDADSETAMVVQEEKVGWVVPPGQPGALSERIREAKASPDCLAEMGRRGRVVAETKYSRESILGRYTALIASLEGNL